RLKPTDSLTSSPRKQLCITRNSDFFPRSPLALTGSWDRNLISFHKGREHGGCKGRWTSCCCWALIVVWLGRNTSNAAILCTHTLFTSPRRRVRSHSLFI
ncbi:unnamed protein product, partial [Ectocarpus sp. 8 AP-2014]